MELAVQEFGGVNPLGPLIVENLQWQRRTGMPSCEYIEARIKDHEKVDGTYLVVALCCTVDGRLSFASFIVTSTMSSSPSTDFATTLPSPEESISEAFVTDISGSVFSDVSESSARLNSGQVVKVAIFSKILRLMASSLRAWGGR